MKKSKHLLYFAALAFTLSFFTSCKEADTPPDEMLSFEPETIMDQVPEALKNSTDEYAVLCVSDIASALDMSTFMGDLVPPDEAVRSTGDTWRWSVSSYTYTMTFYWTYEEDSQKRTWTMEVQFENGTIYPYITAWEKKDGSEGEILYNFAWAQAYGTTEDFEELYWTYHWTKDAAGNYTFSWNYDSSDESFEYFLKYEVKVNADGSGSIDYYSVGTKFYHMEWDTEGNGSWSYYSSGEEYLSGTWTV
ncbi:MAG: hypothetical protein ACOYXB_16775 [Bacteroidota bacterium]